MAPSAHTCVGCGGRVPVDLERIPGVRVYDSRCPACRKDARK